MREYRQYIGGQWVGAQKLYDDFDPYRGTVVARVPAGTREDAKRAVDAAADAGIPPGVINIVPGGREVGAYLVQHRDVDKVACTGSTAAGRRIAETCGRLLRPVTLELGGKSAAIVLDDADLDLAKIGNDLFAATLVNNGQTCYLGTRVLAPRSRYDEVVDTLAAFASSLAVGDALDPATQIGPMASDRAPFGGVKASGIGRELGPDAVTAYQQYKSIYA